MSAAEIARGLLAVVACALAAAAFRHFFYTLASLLPRENAAKGDPPRTRFTILIPAHDEEAGVARTIASAKAQDYPADRFRVVVLADNCTDRTAAIAREVGAEVAERIDPTHPGKGQALAWYVANRAWDDDEALVCFDADSVADAAYLRAIDARLSAGAPAVQGYNGAQSAPDSPLATLSLLTNTMKNAGTYAGRARFGLPAPLMNGWCLSGSVLRDPGWISFSVTEDFEQTLRLAARDIFAAYVSDARILSEKARTFATAGSQRRRWSGGESSLVRQLALPLLFTAIRDRSPARLELAFDVILPGYATLAGMLAMLGTLAAAITAIPPFAAALSGIAFLAFCGAVAFFRAGPSAALVRGVLLVPVFIAWKIALAAKSALRPPSSWKRADRS
ncbi:glycosyltransferase family 2 protein [bacterium]|nr:glycosyltransferase family 2 protein [bacterium]